MSRRALALHPREPRGSMVFMVSAELPRKLTPEEYLALERASDTKHEYWNGEVFAMAGARRAHNLIVTNLVGELRNALRKMPCEVYPSDMKITARSRDKFVYPDASVVCGAPRFADETEDALLNPSCIFEVLSESTEAYDRGRKFEFYRALESVKEVVLVGTDGPRVEHFVRGEETSWTLRVYGPGSTVPLVGCGAALAVDEVFWKVEFGADEERRDGPPPR
ncbi:MAG: Uma2 family endonuclease [Polyangiaceae bacterium]